MKVVDCSSLKNDLFFCHVSVEDNTRVDRARVADQNGGHETLFSNEMASMFPWLELNRTCLGHAYETFMLCNISRNFKDMKHAFLKNGYTSHKMLTDGDRFNSCQVIYSQFGLAIHQNDHQARRRFVEWAQNEIVVVPDFHKQILFSDEAHFWLNGYIKKQNCRIWSEANSQVYVETPLHPEKLTVWCALWAGGIIDPYFFKNDEGHDVTVNGDRYRAMITNFFIPELNNHDVQELWFQQDGATCHTDMIIRLT
ncbi:uncharacterized protein TNCV_1440101 [Trichonephila clavipes]|nr:uncharacterized protein TNCV_1440101 [Trichonephila clavipes]